MPLELNITWMYAKHTIVWAKGRISTEDSKVTRSDLNTISQFETLETRGDSPNSKGIEKYWNALKKVDFVHFEHILTKLKILFGINPSYSVLSQYCIALRFPNEIECERETARSNGKAQLSKRIYRHITQINSISSTFVRCARATTKH